MTLQNLTPKMEKIRNARIAMRNNPHSAAVPDNDSGPSTPHVDAVPKNLLERPSLEPYIGRLERFELFSTNQCYYIVGSNKLNTSYRIIKIDRTLIEKPPEHQTTLRNTNSVQPSYSDDKNKPSEVQTAMADNSHTAKPTLRPLSEFVTEDPNIYSQEEIKDMLDMIHDGNRMTRTDGTPGSVSRNHGGGLKPIVKAYGIVGFIRFLDCYYVTLITKRSKCGSIGGNGVYSIKVSYASMNVPVYAVWCTVYIGEAHSLHLDTPHTPHRARTLRLCHSSLLNAVQ
jgi:hypothetical protein